MPGKEKPKIAVQKPYYCGCGQYLGIHPVLKKPTMCKDCEKLAKDENRKNKKKEASLAKGNSTVGKGSVLNGKMSG